MAKSCSECGVARGKPHAADCSNSGLGGSHRATSRAAQGILVSRTPMKRADIESGLAVSRASGRIVHHTPTELCSCGSGELFRDCHGFVPGGE